MAEIFFNTLKTIFKRIWRVLIKLLGYMWLAIPIIIIFALLYYIDTTLAPDPDIFVEKTFIHAENLLTVADQVRISYNSFSLLAPDFYLFTNTAYLAISDFLLQVRELACPTWPPTDIEQDCPFVYSWISLMHNLLGYLRAVYNIVSAFFVAMANVLIPIIQGGVTSPLNNSGSNVAGPIANTIEVDGLVVLQWLLDFARWFLVDFLGNLASAITYIFQDVADSTAVNGLLDFSSIWNVVISSIDLLFVAFERLFANLFLSVFDRIICSLFVQPVQCFVMDACLFIFKRFPLVMNIFCVYRPIKKEWSCPTLDLDLSGICKVFKGVCNCYACPNILGIKVPCILGQPTCPCDKKYTLYDDLKPLVDALGLHW